MSYAYWDSSFLVLMTKCKFGGGGNGKVTDVRTRKMFLMNKSPISSSRFSSTSPYPCKIVCSRGLFMLMLNVCYRAYDPHSKGDHRFKWPARSLHGRAISSSLRVPSQQEGLMSMGMLCQFSYIHCKMEQSVSHSRG